MWQFDPNQYEEKTGFTIIPVGDHRVRIEDVISKKSNAGRDMFEITLAVSGHSSRLWHYLVLDPSDPKKTNQRIGDFFNSFGIVDFNMANYAGWKGKVGAVRVKHEQYNGENQAKVAFCLNRKNQDKLPPANFGNAVSVAPAANNFATVVDNDDALPFE